MKIPSDEDYEEDHFIRLNQHFNNKNFCPVPIEYKGKTITVAGEAKFLEDCETLYRFRTVPKPEDNELYHHGIHPMICCPPKYIDQNTTQLFCYNREYLSCVGFVIDHDFVLFSLFQA